MQVNWWHRIASGANAIASGVSAIFLGHRHRLWPSAIAFRPSAIASEDSAIAPGASAIASGVSGRTKMRWRALLELRAPHLRRAVLEVPVATAAVKHALHACALL